MVAAYSLLVPRVSLRIPSFFGPILLGGALLVASTITSPTYDGFSVVKFQDPTFKGTIGIWGVCQGYKQDNATTANPNGTSTGNATADALLAKQGTHSSCSSTMVGWTYSLPINGTGIPGVAEPNTNLGVNVPTGADAGDGSTYSLVMSAGQSAPLIVHMFSGLCTLLGLALLLIPYKSFAETSPHLSKFLKTGSLTILLVVIGFVLAIVSFAIDLAIAISVSHNINSLGQPGGTTASIGDIMWFALSGGIVMLPGLWSSRGQMAMRKP